MNLSTCSRTSESARAVDTGVDAATCGVKNTPGRAHSGCPGGSGSGSVTSSTARSRPRLSSSHSAPVATRDPRAALTSRAPSFIRARNPASTMPMVSLVTGASTTTTSASGSRSPTWLTGLTGIAPSRARRATPRTLAQKPAPPPPARGADRAIPDYQHRLAGQAAGELITPAPRGLLQGEPGELAERGENGRHHPLGGAGIVRAPRVAQGNAVRQFGQQSVDPGGQRLHHGKPRHLPHGRDRWLTRKEWRHVELTLVRTGGQGFPVAGALLQVDRRPRPRQAVQRGGRLGRRYPDQHGFPHVSPVTTVGARRLAPPRA